MLDQFNKDNISEVSDGTKCLPPPLPESVFKTGLLPIIFLTLFADFLFWKQPCGWNTALFGFSLAAVLISTLVVFRGVNWKRIVFPTVILIAAVIACTLHRSIIGLLLGIVGLVGITVASRYEELLSLLQWLVEMLKFGIYAVTISIYDICRYMKQRHPINRSLVGSIKIWIIAVGLASGFLFLFSLANPVLEGWFNSLGQWIDSVNINLDFIDGMRVGHFFLYALFVWALLGYRISGGPAKIDVSEPPTLSVKLIDACLILFNLVFALQSALDIGYLFSGVHLPEEFTYAEYAHRGFYPLWIASMFAAGFMLLFWSNDQQKYPPSKFRNGLLFIWIAQNGLLLYSSIYRMNLYVCAYSLTQLRVAALAGMVLVGVGLVGITARIILRKPISWLLNVNGCSVLTMLVFLSLVNVPARIAWFNVEHCKESSGEGVALDVSYLHKLGIDALPALIHFEARHSECERILQVRRVIKRLKKDFEAGSENWRAWTLNRSCIAKSVKQLPDFEVEEYRSKSNPVFKRDRYVKRKRPQVSRFE